MLTLTPYSHTPSLLFVAILSFPISHLLFSPLIPSYCCLQTSSIPYLPCLCISLPPDDGSHTDRDVSLYNLLLPQTVSPISVITEISSSISICSPFPTFPPLNMDVKELILYLFLYVYITYFSFHSSPKIPQTLLLLSTICGCLTTSSTSPSEIHSHPLFLGQFFFSWWRKLSVVTVSVSSLSLPFIWTGH